MLITILEIFAIIIVVLVMGILRLKSLVLIDIEKLIAEAEAMPKTGAEKMQWVVSELYKSIIPIAKAYFTPKRIQSIAQAVFDRVRAYADKYIKRIEK